MRKWHTKPEKEAERILSAFEAECRRLAIAFEPLPVDVEFLGSLLYRLSVERIPNLVIEGRRYPAFLQGNIVGVSADDIPERQRFSIGHELGHYVLHVLPFADTPGQLRFALDDGPNETSRFFRCTEEDFLLASLPDIRHIKEPVSWNDVHLAAREKEYRQHCRREVEANQFSAALLMPPQAVLEAFRDLRDVRRVAERFQVSRQAMETRLISLELVPRSGGLQPSFW